MIKLDFYEPVVVFRAYYILKHCLTGFQRVVIIDGERASIRKKGGVD
jgi:hypothetical protein